MKAQRRARGAAIVAAIVLVAGVIAVPAASAGTSCPTTKICIWDYDHWSGNWWYTGGNNYLYHDDNWFGTSETIDNDAESAHNNGTSGMGVYFFDYSGYFGPSYCVAWKVKSEFSGGSDFDNKASSHLWSWSCK